MATDKYIERVSAGAAVIRAYMATRSGLENEDETSLATDLIADVMHYVASTYGTAQAKKSAALALVHFEAEQNEPGDL